MVMPRSVNHIHSLYKRLDKKPPIKLFINLSKEWLGKFLVFPRTKNMVFATFSRTDKTIKVARKFRVRETKNPSTDADSKANTILKKLSDKKEKKYLVVWYLFYVYDFFYIGSWMVHDLSQKKINKKNIKRFCIFSPKKVWDEFFLNFFCWGGGVLLVAFL